MGVIVAIFAHPDDEAFGPGATIAKMAEDHDVYIICVTNGNDKTRKYDDEIKEKGLANIRNSELDASAEVLGVKKVFYLNYEDGQLCNNIYHEVASKIEKILKELKPEALMTFENRGVSGHIDHIFLSMVTAFVFKKVESVKKLYYYCISSEERDEVDDYFIYFPPGYSSSEIDETFELEDFWDKKVAAVMCHSSQLEDPNKCPEWLLTTPKKEHFIVLKK